MVVCKDNCNKCIASHTSQLLFHTLVRRLDERDAKRKRTKYNPFYKFKLNKNVVKPPEDKSIDTAPESPLLFENHDEDVIPSTQPVVVAAEKKTRRKRKLPTTQVIKFVPGSKPPTDSEKKYYCYSGMRVQDKKCCDECKPVTRKDASSEPWTLL
jgi:hypothetical protein